PLLSLYHLLTLSFFPYPPTSEIFPLSLHDALPISEGAVGLPPAAWLKRVWRQFCDSPEVYLLLSNLCRTLPRTPRPASTTSSSQDRKSTRLNSSHVKISYAVFCLKKKINRKIYEPE